MSTLPSMGHFIAFLPMGGGGVITFKAPLNCLIQIEWWVGYI